MASTVSNKPLTFALSYGFAEGAAHGRKISRLLKQAGFEPAKSIVDADVIIAHSAGCWLMPDNARPKLILYVGMPLPLTNAQKIWLKANWLNVRSFLAKGNVLKMLRIATLNTYYSLRHFRRSLDIVKGVKTAVPTVFGSTSTVFIANQHDPWPHSARLQNYIDKEHWSFLSLSGSHNNIWQHPAYYVDIIKKYAELLAKTNQR